MKNHLYLSVVLCLMIAISCTIGIEGQKVMNLKCKDRPVQQNFDIKRYMGKWFLLYRYYTIFQKGCECNIANYTLNADGSFTNSLCCLKMNIGMCSDGMTLFTNPNQQPLEGKFNTFTSKTSNYLVLETDYDNFTIIYACVATLNSPPIEGLWVQSRTPILDPKVSEKVHGLLETYSFDKSLYIVTNHDPKLCGNVKWIDAATLAKMF